MPTVLETLRSMGEPRPDGKQPPKATARGMTGADGRTERLRLLEREADLLTLIREDTGEAGEEHGTYVAFRSCPVCRHANDFRFYRSTNSWVCYGGSNPNQNADGREGGSYVKYLMRARGYDRREAEMALCEATGGEYPETREARAFSKAKGDAGSAGGGRRSWDHAAWSDELMREFHVCYIDGVVAVWRDGGYRLGRDALMGAMVAKWPSIRAHQRREAEKYICIVAPRFEQDEESDMLIAFANGALDLRTMELRENVPGLRIPNVVPHAWNGGAECADVDEAIRAWSCGDQTVARQIEEVVGVAMFRGRLSQCAYVVGGGGSGKSTFLEALTNVVGAANVASIDITHVGRRFQSVALMGKCANVADDVSLEGLGRDEFSVLKRIITKNAIEYEHKGGETGSFRPYATQIFAGNALPRLPEAGRQVTRRFVTVRFKADFTGRTARDARGPIEARLRTEAAAERLIYLGVHALRGVLFDSGGLLTEGCDARDTERELLSAASSVAAFAIDALGWQTADFEGVAGRRTADVYREYRGYCEETERRAVARNNFTSELCALLGLGTVRTRHQRPTGGYEQVSTFAEGVA